MTQPHFLLFVIILFRALCLDGGHYFIEHVDREDDYAYHKEYTEHSYAHMLESSRKSADIKADILRYLLNCLCNGFRIYCGIERKAFEYIEKSHFSSLPLHKEIENKSARDYRGDLSRNVYTDRVHKKEVLRILFKSHLMYNTT